MSEPDVRDHLVPVLDRLRIDVERPLEDVVKRAKARDRRARVATTMAALSVAAVGMFGVWRLTSLGEGEELRFRAALPGGTQISFDDPRDGDSEIYLVRGDGRLVQLTDNGHTDGQAAWSPDGEQLAFMSDRDGDRDIYVMNADGSGVRQVTNGAGDEDSPSWSPDGESIVFNSWAETQPIDDRYDLFIVDVATGFVQKLPTGLANERFPAWSPNGPRIAFSAQRGFGKLWEIYIIDLVEGTVRPVSDLDVSAYLPAWSPDGSTIAFESERDEVHLVDVDGERPKPVPLSDDGPVEGADVEWSPNGRWLAFTSTGGMYVLDVTDPGASPILISESGYSPAFRPTAGR